MSQPSKLMVGCPFRDRGWIIDRWRDHVEAAFEHSPFTELEYVMAVSESDPDVEKLPFVDHLIVSGESYEPYGDRKWNASRYEVMADLRNSVLKRVRLRQPDAFLSLDSDILIPETLISDMAHLFELYDAIGGLTWLDHRDRNITNIANWSGQSFQRIRTPLSNGRCDILMAIKLMSPNAYIVDYEPHSHGEDLGWSLAAQNAGLQLGYCGTPSKHVMRKELLDVEDARVGW